MHPCKTDRRRSVLARLRGAVYSVLKIERRPLSRRSCSATSEAVGFGLVQHLRADLAPCPIVSSTVSGEDSCVLQGAQASLG